ncbi:MarC family protein [Ktedonosporobacter rubrisoli]|uniref:MarC family protein n=1 Tax=Ktedonosporobacter rubrisoli TaxID=2509675 RepID=UPI0013EEA02A|nr:MarC family protein [Ktedonosporobacter rubrisoli]
MTFTISAFVTFFTIIDPVGLAPIVLGLTSQLDNAQRNSIITRAVLISAVIIAFFAFVGRFLLDRLGIQLYAFNIAGGALLFLVAVDMLFGRQSGARETKAEQEEALTREDISVFPLAIPMIAGPGTIATTILYVGLATPNPLNLLSVAAAIASSLLAAWIVMRSSSWIINHVGRTGILVLSRLLGILLAALAVQFIFNGISAFTHMEGLLK